MKYSIYYELCAYLRTQQAGCLAKHFEGWRFRSALSDALAPHRNPVHCPYLHCFRETVVQ